MILYQLACSEGHEFEAWFRDSATYDEQRVTGDISCPYCGDDQVVKALTAPHVARSNSEKSIQTQTPEARAHELASHILRAVKKVREDVEASSDYVGDQFAEEARRIHYGETEERNIYGEATTEEADELDDEGIEFYRLPNYPRRND